MSTPEELESEAAYETAIDDLGAYQAGRLDGLLAALAAVDKGGKAQKQIRDLIEEATR